MKYRTITNDDAIHEKVQNSTRMHDEACEEIHGPGRSNFLL